MNLNILYSALSIIFLSFVLIKAVSFLVTSSIKLAHYLKISEYTVSFLIIALATSLPELIIGIAAAVDNKSILSLGNVVGSNIADLTIILAIPIFVGGAISTKVLIKNHDLTIGTLISILPVFLMLDGNISRLDGIFLLATYFSYVIYSLKKANDKKQIQFFEHEVNVIKEFAILLLSSSALWLSANTLVHFAENLSKSTGVSLLVVGMVLTAIGTSLPELAFGLKAIKAKHKGEVIGSIMGSAVANSTLILGTTAVINPIYILIRGNMAPYIFLILVVATFFIFSLTRKRIGKKEAAILCVLYILFILVTI